MICKDCKVTSAVYVKLQLCRKCRKQLADYKSYMKDYSRNSYANKREQIFNRYGITCKCCGESNQVFLTIDHVDGGGRQHRSTISRTGGGTAFYNWLVKMNFPVGFQTLCMNCNWAKRYGPCPHQQ